MLERPSILADLKILKFSKSSPKKSSSICPAQAKSTSNVNTVQNAENVPSVVVAQPVMPAQLIEPPVVRIPRSLLYTAPDISGEVNIVYRKWLFWEKSHMDSAYVTIMSWNVLAPRFANAPVIGHNELNWNTRKVAILDQIVYYEPDFICLQEMDPNEYENYFRSRLKDQGYTGVFVAKSPFDGLATFFRNERFDLKSSQFFRYSDASLSDQTRPSIVKDKAIRLAPFSNIASCLILKNKVTKKHIRLINTHLLWQEDFKDTKLLQSAILMDYLAQQKVERNTATVICADLNSVPKSPVLRFLLSGRVSTKHFLGHDFGKFTEKQNIRHKLNLESAYQNSKMSWTHAVPHFKGTIDYILYSSDQLRLVARLEEADANYFNSVIEFSGLPTVLNPSDHIPLVSIFKH